MSTRTLDDAIVRFWAGFDNTGDSDAGNKNTAPSKMKEITPLDDGKEPCDTQLTSGKDPCIRGQSHPIAKKRHNISDVQHSIESVLLSIESVQHRIEAVQQNIIEKQNNNNKDGQPYPTESEQLKEITAYQSVPTASIKPQITDKQLRILSRKHLLMMIRDLEKELEQEKKEKECFQTLYQMISMQQKLPRQQPQQRQQLAQQQQERQEQ